MKEIKAIIRPDQLDDVLRELRLVQGLPGVTVSTVRGFGRRHPERPEEPADARPAEFSKVETVVPSRLAAEVIGVIRRYAHTGRPSDGKIFVLPVEAVTRISTGEEGEEAI